MSKNHRDPETSKSTTDIGEPFTLAWRMIDLGLIGVDFTRNTVVFDVGLQSGQNIVSILRRCEMHEDTPRSIIDRNQETARRATTFEPIMMASVELDE